ncbi:unnamed protein product [Calicophoron daubneyi]|uniref:Uncharacterized protein n=1 Tax=Calicophoron daubneyi TaxID=300641 RepID=A0AAV2TDQ5_CALDB
MVFIVSLIFPPHLSLVGTTFSLFLKVSAEDYSSLLIFPGLCTPSKLLLESGIFRMLFGDCIRFVSPWKDCSSQVLLMPYPFSILLSLLSSWTAQEGHNHNRESVFTYLQILSHKLPLYSV